MKDFFAKLPEPINTQRLILRAPTLDDVDRLVQLANNKQLVRWLARLPHPYKEEHGIDFIQNIVRTKIEHGYAIINRQNEFMGLISLRATQSGEAELGYWIGESYWGKGYASEAVFGLINSATNIADCPPIIARALSDNIGSIKVLEKNGFMLVDKRIDDCGQHKNKSVSFFNLSQIK